MGMYMPGFHLVATICLCRYYAFAASTEDPSASGITIQKIDLDKPCEQVFPNKNCVFYTSDECSPTCDDHHIQEVYICSINIGIRALTCYRKCPNNCADEPTSGTGGQPSADSDQPNTADNNKPNNGEQQPTVGEKQPPTNENQMMTGESSENRIPTGEKQPPTNENQITGESPTPSDVDQSPTGGHHKPTHKKGRKHRLGKIQSPSGEEKPQNGKGKRPVNKKKPSTEEEQQDRADQVPSSTDQSQANASPVNQPPIETPVNEEDTVGSHSQLPSTDDNPDVNDPPPNRTGDNRP